MRLGDDYVHGVKVDVASRAKRVGAIEESLGQHPAGTVVRKGHDVPSSNTLS